MADNKSSECIKFLSKEKHQKPHMGVDFATGRDFTVILNVSDAIKGLKAVQREAKKATAALKELAETTPDTLDGVAISKSIQSANGYSPNSVVFDEMHCTVLSAAAKCKNQ
ncbi:hypothetical protein [Ornithinibacillus bavariensis]|uniref:hypothetical protein n=1 Tax=Ornithinibacillus bavariensis TaxID=545502 RepID=UPI000ECD2B7F|nr:hypothetical protein [Ornithinibacillus sp.]